MSIVKIEMLTINEVFKGKKLYGSFIEDKMYYEGMPLCDKYILRLLDEDMVSYGFVSRETLFAEYSSRDIIQAMIDAKIDFNKKIEFEILKIEDISRNNKKLVTLKLLDNKLISQILGENNLDNNNIDIDKLLEKYNNNLMNVNNSKPQLNITNEKLKSSISEKEVILTVKGDAKSNPKRTTITRRIKNSELPLISISQDEELKFRIVYENEFAGEILDVPSDLDINNVISVKCDSYVSLGYKVNIKYIPTLETGNLIKENKIESNISTNTNTDSKEVTQLELNISSSDENLDISKSIQVAKDINSVTVAPKKYFKADKQELTRIIEYLEKNNISEELIDKILSSHEPFEEKYSKRIPHSSDENFVPWVISEGDKNLLLLAIAQIEEGFNLRFVGGKGVGKDTLSQTLCWIYQRPRYTQSASVDTDTSILIGDKDLQPKIVGDTVVQTIGFETGLLIEAMEIGGFFELGEGNSCRPGVLMSLHTILDSRKYMDVKGYKLVKSHNRFSFILTMNVDYEGCNNLNQAFRDRFSTIKFPPPKSIKKVLKKTCPFAKEKDIDICDRIYKTILTTLATELQDEEVVTVRGYIRTLQMAKYVPLADALECCIINNVSDDYDTSNRVRQIIENIIG